MNSIRNVCIIAIKIGRGSITWSWLGVAHKPVKVAVHMGCAAAKVLCDICSHSQWAGDSSVIEQLHCIDSGL